MGKARILLIDDEEDFLLLMKKNLELQGYEIITATDGDLGLEKARSLKPDLVICDWSMPKKNGCEVLKEFRKDKSLRIPFIILTAVDDFDKVREAYDSEVDFYAPKTIELQKLYKRITTILNLSKNRIW
ncbi:MAG: response regulator [Omnitrophica bacterium]|nr:response regulator [Candidatus Omnitrophota bacterium]